MERLIELLNEKNHYLEKFYALNEAELHNFTVGNFENLDQFYKTREKILEILKYVDSEVNKEHQTIVEVSQAPAQHRAAVREALTIKDEYVSRIIGQDLEVLACIEAAKNNIIRELQEVRKNKKGIVSYKSPTFHQRLDEEV